MCMKCVSANCANFHQIILYVIQKSPLNFENLHKIHQTKTKSNHTHTLTTLGKKEETFGEKKSVLKLIA